MLELTWLITGLLSSGTVVIALEVRKQTQLSLLLWICFVLGSALVLFALPWAVGSILEGVPRAASMGILLFGLPGIVLLTISANKIIPQLRSPVSEATEVDIPIIQKDEEPARRRPSKVKPQKWPQPLAYGAYIALVLAYIAGVYINRVDYAEQFQQAFPDAEIEVLANDPPVFKLTYPDGQVNFAGLGTGQGYGGPLIIGAVINEEGVIEKVRLVANQETPAYRQRVAESEFASQALGKMANQSFIVGDDIDGVTGATVSCVASSQALRQVAHYIAAEQLGLEQSWGNETVVFGIEEALILLLVVLAFVKKIHKNKWLRYGYLLSVLIVVGFWTNSSLSIGSLGALALGFVTSVKANLIWWLLIAATIGGIVVLSRNVWCNTLCPFFGVQYFLTKVSGKGVGVPDWLRTYGPIGLSFFLWVSLMVIFLTRNPSLGSYEPFSMMFSLNGVGIQWYILPASIIGAFFVPLFWCRFFCPLGHCINRLVLLRKKIKI